MPLFTDLHFWTIKTGLAGKNIDLRYSHICVTEFT